jgi:hypothetical protein
MAGAPSTRSVEVAVLPHPWFIVNVTLTVALGLVVAAPVRAAPAPAFLTAQATVDFARPVATRLAPDEALGPVAGAPQLFWATRPRGGAFGAVPAAPGRRAGPLVMLDDGTAGDGGPVVTVWSSTALSAGVRPPGGAFGPPEHIAPTGDFPVLAAGDPVAVAVWLSGGRLMAAARAGP